MGMQSDPVADMLLSSRYLLPGETPPEMFSRVAGAVGRGNPEPFREVMQNLLFLPNSPTLMNAGTPSGQLSACFVLPVEDSISAIFTALSYMARIHQSGGGTGFSFSHIRPRGDDVRGARGVASGPISFIRVFDEATSALKQGGKRRGANMGVLLSSHPDIRAFITSKQGGALRNFNLSVGFDKTFFRCLERNDPYDLVNPRDGVVWNSIDPRLLWQMLGEAAWATGDPGVLFLEAINAGNTVPGLGTIEATNPCGEQPLLPYESCNLGSVNLARCIRGEEIDYALLGSVVRTGVDFLDAVIDVNTFPVPGIGEKTRLTRKIGLGVMGLADAFIRLRIPYESRQALVLCDRIMGFIHQVARERSAERAEILGSFPAINKSIFSGPMRNATVTTVAPTGSLHLIACTSSGIEPVFSLVSRRQINGNPVVMVHPAIRALVKSIGGGTDMIAEICRTGSVQGLSLPDETKDLLKTATEITPEYHVRMQATVQKHVDNAVSKTVNMPEHATAADICRIFAQARELGCKGITVYRYNSKPDQVLSCGCETCRID
jgi:ribonucleoside-diphosphate reductase alpha chain